jgi:putative ABC transport system permease protein
MLKARNKNILRNIRDSLNRFLSIAAIVALGTGFLGGLVATTPDMEMAAAKYMSEAKMYDIDVRSALGYTEDEVKSLSGIEGIGDFCCANVTDQVLISGSQRFTARVFGYLDSAGTATMNRLTLVSGRMPSRPFECVVQSPNGYTTTLPKEGDTLRFFNSPSAPGGFAYSFAVISGIVRSPLFISAESEPSMKGVGNISLAVYTMRSFYSLSTYTDIYMTVPSRFSTWSPDYDSLIAGERRRLLPVEERITDSRIDSVKSAAGKVVESVALSANVQEALARDRNFRTLQSYRIESMLNSHGGRNARLLASRIGATADACRILKDSVKPASITAETADSLLKGQFALMDKMKGKISGVNTRKDNTGYASYKSNIDKIAAMSRVFPAFFFFIAILVSLTTMTRLVDERRSETGTLKALGFSNWQLLSEYLAYAFLATLLGSFVGLEIGFKLFPRVISKAYGMMYAIPPVETPFRWNIALVSSGIAMVGILLATLWACLSETGAVPAVLMTPKAPAAGRRILLERIGFIWKRLSFSVKVTARNLFRYKKRLYMTVFGIAGCSALLVAAFGLRDSIYDIVDKQFNEICKYDLMMMFEDSKVPACVRDVSSDYLPFRNEAGRVMNGSKVQPVFVYVPDNPDSLRQFVDLRHRKSHRPIALTDDGVVLSEKLCEQLGVHAGDSVTVENGDGLTGRAKVLGGAENYVYGLTFMTPREYRTLFNAKPDFTSAICKLKPGKDNDATLQELMDDGSVVYTLSSRSLRDTAYKEMRSIYIVVLVLILASGILSMVVLYNLANINICERKRELATLLVLGYTQKEAQRYIFREIDILSFMGTALGLLLGAPLHSFVIRTTEVNAAMWGRTVYPMSYVYAALISIGFTFLINLLMRRSINGINMVESMKTGD